MSDRHHTKSHHKDFCITMHVLPNVPYLPGRSLKLSVANSEKCRRVAWWPPSAAQGKLVGWGFFVHTRSWICRLLCPTWKEAVERGLLIDYRVLLPKNYLQTHTRPKWQNYSNCWTGSTQNVQRVGVLKCAMTSWDLWRILWSVTTWYCGLVYPPTTTWWYILVHLLDIEAQCNTEIHHWDTRMLKICQCDNRVCSNVAIRHMAIW